MTFWFRDERLPDGAAGWAVSASAQPTLFLDIGSKLTILLDIQPQRFGVDQRIILGSSARADHVASSTKTMTGIR